MTTENISPTTPAQSTPLTLSQRLSQAVPLTWENILIGGFLLLAVVSRLANLGARVMSHDESLHVYYSWLFSVGTKYTHNPMMHGPSLFEFTAFINRLFGANDFTSRLVPVILGIFLAVGIPQLLKPWLGRAGALAVTGLMLISPYVLYFSRYIRHDIQVLAWTLLAVVAIFRYLENRQRSELYLLAVALGLMLSTMEISFFYLAIFAVYLVARALNIYGFTWGSLRRSAEFDLLVVVVTLGAFFSSPIALPLLNPIFTRLTSSPYIEVKVFDTQVFEWLQGPVGLRVWILFGLFAAASAAVGLWWGRLTWLKIAGIFALVVVPLYTTFFLHWKGFGTGLVGSLGYWLSQQAVERGSQPWYYYLIVMPVYEYLAVFGGLAGAVYFFARRLALSERERGFIPFLLFWAGIILAALSAAGEKMPWLSTHIVVPFLFLAGWWVGRLLSGLWVRSEEESAQPQAVSRSTLWRGAALLVVGVLALATIRTSYLVNYVNYDYSTEFIDYAHGAPGVKWTLADIDRLGEQLNLGRDIKVAYDDEVSWPITWYMHDYPNQTYFGDQPNREALNAPVVIAGSKNWGKVEAIVGDRYHRYEVIRMWWPMEDYKNLSRERIVSAIRDPQMRRALWQIFWNRDYTLYAELTGQAMDPPRTWPLQDRMRVYIQKEAADAVPDLTLAAYQIEDLPPMVDAYKDVQKTFDPLNLVSPGLNGPRGLAASPDGFIYVADTGNSQIVKLDSSGQLVKAWGGRTAEGQLPPPPGTFIEPWGIAASPQGEIFVADTWNHRIQVFNADGVFLREWGVGGLRSEGPDRFWGPRGVVVDPSGRVYVTDTGNKRVGVFDSTGNFLFDFEQDGEAALNEPVGLALDAEGQIYVADTWNSRVAVFTPEGQFVRSFPVQGWSSDSLDNKPFLAVDSAGRVYITDPEGYRVIVFDALGEPLAVFGQYGPEQNSFGLPAAPAVAPDGTLWITDAANQRLAQFDLWPD